MRYGSRAHAPGTGGGGQGTLVDPWIIAVAATAYVALLVAVAWWGDSPAGGRVSPRLRVVVYGLSLGIYFTSWTFFGAVGNAARSGWDYLPIYLGPFLVMTLGFPVVRRMVRLGRRMHSTSIADFLSARYGKSSGLAALVTVIAVIGALPYIALQLKSVAMSLTVLSGNGSGRLGLEADGLVLPVALALAGFAILFGTRHVDTTEHNRGMIMAIAVEGAVKVLALAAVALFVLHEIGWTPIEAAFWQAGSPFMAEGPGDRFLTLVLLAMAAILCLPRQFHVSVVECQDDGHISPGRWIFVAALIVTMAVVVPIAVAGPLSPASVTNPDLYVLTIPLASGAEGLALIAFIGGFSAATGMVIVSSLALSTMVTNDLLTAYLLRNRLTGALASGAAGRHHLVLRRVVIVLLLLAASAYHYGVTGAGTLASLGVLSFAGAAQFLPALIGGLYWRRGHKRGVTAGLAAGLALWLLLLMAPAHMGSGWVDAALAPALWAGVDPLTFGVVVSLGVNLLLYVGVSLLARPGVVDRVQAAAFLGAPADVAARPAALGRATVMDLRTVVERCLGTDRTDEAFRAFELLHGRPLGERDPVDGALSQFAEQQIARVIGAASARILVGSVLADREIAIEDIATVLGETQERLHFSRELLQATLDNLSQGVSVVDSDLRLVAWNQRYLDLFQFPTGLIQVGRHISEVIRYNVENGECGPGEVEAHVARRTARLAERRPHTYERARPDGTVLKTQGNPMPGGGYVTSFTDITANKRIEEALKQSEQSIRFYMDNIPALVAYVDTGLRLRFANRAYMDWYARGRPHLLGLHVKEILSPEEHAHRLPYMQAALAGEKQLFDMDVVDGHGRPVFLQVVYTPQLDAGGAVQGFFVLYQDISRRRRAELALQETNESLEQRVTDRTQALRQANLALAEAKRMAEDATRSKTRFLAAASHDLLQPLNAARLFGSALREDLTEGTGDTPRHAANGHRRPIVAEGGASDHQVSDPHTPAPGPDRAGALSLLTKLDKSIQSADRLIRALLDISKLDAGGMTAEPGRFAIDDILSELSAEFSVIAENRGLALTHVPCSAVVETDKGLIYSVIQNLVSNAVRYTQAGRVLVGCRRRPGAIEVQVLDTGPGIPHEKQQAIFREFERLDTAPPANGSVSANGARSGLAEEKGLGLGLAIAARISDLLGLDLRLRSVPGRGSLFSVTVPLGDGVMAGEGRRPGFHSHRLAEMSLLCIDNDEQVLDGQRALLERWGCRVQVARNGAEALSLYDAGTTGPDVVLLDYRLDNGETGPQVYQDLTQVWHRQPPAILMTADRLVGKGALSVGRDPFGDMPVLAKPVEPAVLRAALEQLIRRPGA